MTPNSRVLRALACFATCSILAVAQTSTPQPESSSWLDEIWNLPIIREIVSFATVVDPQPPAQPAAPVAVVPSCGVAAVPAIDDPEALAFEANVGSALIVNTSGLTPATAAALVRFQGVVSSVGGTMELKSAFRPASYQEHLQNVWDKWKEIRNNQELGCQALKAQVHDEFTRHRLLETQRPVALSDHTRGVGFDATVLVPSKARLRRRLVSLDFLARVAGFRRPDILHDPVHFRFVGGRTTRA